MYERTPSEKNEYWDNQLKVQCRADIVAVNVNGLSHPGGGFDKPYYLATVLFYTWNPDLLTMWNGATTNNGRRRIYFATEAEASAYADEHFDAWMATREQRRILEAL